MNDLGIGPAKEEDHEKLLKHWKERINYYNLDIQLSPDMEDDYNGSIVSMKDFIIYVTQYMSILLVKFNSHN